MPDSSAASPGLLLPVPETRTALEQLARQVVKNHPTGENVVLIGIQTGGVRVAEQLAPELEKLWGRPVPLGQLDVTMHRDDLDRRLAPPVHPTHLPGDIADKEVILVDDVFCSGRTTRAALDALHDLGRPRRIQLAVLIERCHQELPIRPDFVGRRVETAPEDQVVVEPGDPEKHLHVRLEAGAPAQPPAP
jgi:pyrimidine operon attenuation protein/uracil phosphoribosyltransferase